MSSAASVKVIGGITQGSYIVGGPLLSADPRNDIFQHEYGHYRQSMEMGWTYYSRVGIPSLLSTSFFTGDYYHKYHPVEVDANNRAFMYFSQTVEGFGPSDWNSSSNPLSNNVDNLLANAGNFAYLNTLFKSGLLPPSFIDYLAYVSPIFALIAGGLNTLLYRMVPYPIK